jgi:hypothetical protein
VKAASVSLCETELAADQQTRAERLAFEAIWEPDGSGQRSRADKTGELALVGRAVFLWGSSSISRRVAMTSLKVILRESHDYAYICPRRRPDS